MYSVLQEIEKLREGLSVRLNETLSNRYTLHCQESRGIKTAYCFSVPIRNIKTNDIVNLRFYHNKQSSIFIGSGAKISVSDRIRILNQFGQCDTTWAYDNNGNIIARYECAITAKPTSELHLLNGTCKLYTYDDNSDRLMSYNGETFEYDVIGNPTTYRGKTATWAYGRQLTAYDGNTFAYDARGRRIAKNGIAFTYDSNGSLIKQSNGLEFLYDHTGVFAVKYNHSTYFYRKNALNDVIALLDSTGKIVVKYKYDAWGKCVIDTSTTNTELATLNPFRYRGYCYDEEIGLYYLQSRYYNASVGRFINGDEIAFSTVLADCLLANNLFSYAYNNPVINLDSNGYSTMAAYAVTSAPYSEMIAISVAATSLMASIKAFVAMIWNIFVVVGLLLLVIGAIVYICKTISTIYDAIEDSVKADEDDYKNKYKNQLCVYVLAHEKGNVNSVFYVGRTNNTVARYNKHKETKGSFYMFVVYPCTSLEQSRVVEQCVLAACLTGKFTNIMFGEKPSNRINGISKKKAKSAVYKLGKETKETLSLLGCTADSDWLLLMGY